MTFKAVRPVPPESNSNPKSQLKIPGGDLRINPVLLSNVNPPFSERKKKPQVRELLTCSRGNCKIIRFDRMPTQTHKYTSEYIFLENQSGKENRSNTKESCNQSNFNWRT